MFCAPGLVFGGTEGIRSCFHMLCSQTRFRRCRGHRVPFSCFAFSDSFSAVPSASGPVFMFCVPGIIFGGTEGVGTRFHVLRCRTHFQRYRRRRVRFSCFALPDSFSAIPRTSGPSFMFYTPELIFVGTEGVRSHFHVWRSRTRFQRYRGCRVPFLCFALPQFSCFALPDSFSAVPRASGHFSYFELPDSFSAIPWASGSHFHVLRAHTRFRRY
jgi:hypothetical protein